MSYLYDRQQKNKKITLFVIFFGIIILLFFPVHRWVYQIFEKPLTIAMENSQELRAEGSSLFQTFFSHKALLEKYEQLQQDYQRLSVDVMRTDYLSQHLDSISNIIENEQLPAYRIYQGSFGSRDTLFLRFDSKFEIEQGDMVLAYNNLLLGHIDEVFKYSARARLLSDKDMVSYGIVYPHEISVELHGSGNGSFIIEAPRGVDFQEGDVIYSLEYPGKIIARIRHVEFDARDPFKKVYASFPVDINNVSLVSIEKTLQK